MTRKEYTALFLIGIGIGLLCLTMFRWRYDSNDFQTLARSQIGQNESTVIQTLGPPKRRWSQSEFNSNERLKIEGSFSPKPVPIAEGSVLQYDKFPAIILLYLEDGIVTQVYIGAT